VKATFSVCILTCHIAAALSNSLQTCSRVNAGMLAAHRALYKAATEGNLTAFNAQVAEVQRLFLITYIQATLKYAELMDRATAKGDQDTLLADQVGCRGFWCVCNMLGGAYLDVLHLGLAEVR
jgi:hypothetical protein